ncbi:serine hydrolase domain-containing protein [Maribacter sp. 2210JD10-5]|uniref:serine hydrolase domain-containing protein n=1 Tax=Maribacter sp. 2210JD10-5 TaxID=3386272 RepID=UPI0039BD4A26
MHLIILLANLILLSSCEKGAEEAPIQLSNLEKKIIRIAKRGNIPSLAVYVETEDDVLKVDYHHPDTEKQTIYGIGSTTKFLSAALVFKLIEKGQLNLEDMAVDYVEELVEIDDGNSITIGNLLNHTSGLSDYTAHSDWREAVVNGGGPKDFNKKFSYIKKVLRNRGRYMYSNSNYLILQGVVEKVLSKPYTMAFNDFFKNHGLSNLNLGNANLGLQAFYATDDKASSNVSGWRENYGYDGGAFGTPKEINAFLQGFFVKKNILKDETISKMRSWIPMNPMSIPIGDGSINSYGFGIMKLNYRGKEYIGHAGSTLKYQSFMFYDPKKKTSINVFTNCSGKHYNNVFFQEIIPEILDNL